MESHTQGADSQEDAASETTSARAVAVEDSANQERTNVAGDGSNNEGKIQPWRCQFRAFTA